MWSFCAEFSLKSEVDESFEIHVLMNFLRVTWLTIKDSLQSKVFLGIFKYIALKTFAHQEMVNAKNQVFHPFLFIYSRKMTSKPGAASPY